MPFAPREVFDPRIAVSRATPGGRFNSAGMFEMVAANLPRYDYDPRAVSARNLFLYSEFQNGLSTLPTRTANVTVADMSSFPGFDTGIEFGVAGAESYGYINPQLQPSTRYYFSCFVRMEDGLAPSIPAPGNPGASQNDFGIVIDNSYTASGPYLIENYGYGVYRVSNTLVSRAVLSGNMFVGVSKGASNSSRRFKTTGWQLNKGSDAGVYLPTLDKVVGNAMAKGVLVEEGKINYLLQSDNQTVSPWSGTASPALVKTLDNSGPGGLPATTFLADGSTESIWGYTTLTASATVVTASCYIKKVGSDTTNKRLMVHNRTTATYYTGDWNPNTGAIVGAGWTSEEFEDGWWLCTFTQSSGITAGDGLSFYQGMVGANRALHNFKVSAPQFENGPIRTSYIPTTTAATSRNGDILSVPAATLKYRAIEGAMIFDGFHSTHGFNGVRAGLHLGTNVPNRRVIYTNGSVVALSVSNGAATSKTQNPPAAAAGVRTKFGITWDSTGFWISANGNDPEFTSAPVPIVDEDKLYIGSRNGFEPWNACVSGAEYYPRKLSTAQLKALTAL